MIQVTFPFAQFTDKAGQPLDAGFIYIGTENLNPETNPIALFWDDALTIPAAQPLRTINGYISRNGSPGRVYTNTSAYSITVRDKSLNLVATALDASALDNLRADLAAPSGASLVGFDVTTLTEAIGTIDWAIKTVSGGVNVLRYIPPAEWGAIFARTSTYDTTADIQAAINANPDKTIYSPAGIYKTTDTLTISTSTTLVGDGQDATVIMCFKSGGYAITVTGGFYDKPATLERFTLRNADPTTYVSGGVSVDSGTWGVSLIVRDFTMQYFPAKCWNFKETFTVTFDNVVTIGHAGASTLLHFPTSTTFANQFIARNSTFFIGRIGIQSLGCASSSFDGCTFESLDLFLNIESITGITVFMTVTNSWFELIGAGIVNSRLAVGLLTPELPAVNKQNIERIVFENNYSSASLASPFVNAALEPLKGLYFGVRNGYVPSASFKPLYNTYTVNNGQPANSTVREIIGTHDLTFLKSPTGFGNTGFFTIKVTAGVNGGNQITALYTISRIGATAALLGTIDDPFSYGATYKVSIAWSGNSIVVSCNAQGAYTLQTEICSIGTLG